MQRFTSWSASRELSMNREQLWDLMWRPETAVDWLGDDMKLEPRLGSSLVLSDQGMIWRAGRVIASRKADSIIFLVNPARSWHTRRLSRVAIQLSDRSKDRCLMLFRESSIPAQFVSEADRYWNRLIDRLGKVAGRVNKRREKPRQAIVLIHGIGEQRPGDILRGFLASGVLGGGKTAVSTWIKPDRLSNSYELRRASIEGSGSQPATDVYECYWAHIIRDTTLENVFSWLQGLLLRRAVPKPLMPLWVVTWLIVFSLLIGVILTAAGVPKGSGLLLPPLLVLAGGLLWRYLGIPLATNYLGDAMRYLQPHPRNVAHRNAIRDAGVTLIEKLHASGRYDRIVLVGHSLGSVIAYDIIIHSWIRLHQDHCDPSTPDFKLLHAVEKAVLEEPSLDPASAQEIQHQAWRQLRINTQKWLISDLVTLGSPLTYADFLITESPRAFLQAKLNRILPTCPPQFEIKKINHGSQAFMTWDLAYDNPDTGQSSTFTLFHHAAPFAVTRWSNLYFESRMGGLSGDLIGGPIAPLLGSWIKDVSMASPKPGFMHTSYWQPLDDKNLHLELLKNHLKLESKSNLKNLLQSIPAYSLLSPGRGR